MTEQDGEDDPKLRALRAVWLEMPDEDPPERGLGELMAAARAKADELVRPAWWRQMFDVMRRPPVLALATVMVLIAGAVLVGRDKGELADPPPAGTSQPVPAATPVTPPGSAAIEKTPSPADPGPATIAAPAPARSPENDNQRPAPGHPAGPANPPMPTFDKLDREAPSTGGGKDRAKASPKTTIQIAKPAPRGFSEQGPDDNAADEGAVQTRTTDPAPATTGVGELLSRCRSAAARGDCTAARAIAARIAKQDSGYYRTHVASDGALTKCFAGL